MKFDYVVGNPPYLGGKLIYLKIFNISVDILENNGEIVFIQPAMPYFNKKEKQQKAFNDFISNINKYQNSVEFGGEKYFKTVNITNALGIINLRKTKGNNKIQNVIYNDSKRFSNIPIQAVNKLEIEPHLYLKSKIFFKNLIEKNGSINQLIDKCNNSKLSDKGSYFKLALIRGNVDLENGGIKSDFFTFFSSKNYQETLEQKNIRFGIRCNKEYFENLRSYLNTKFARYGLSLLKFDFNMSKSNLEFVPYVDFSQDWNDKKLFEYFEVPENIQKIIMDLPDIIC
jgi:hypothetical protein